jgi:hypothetical protein
MRTVEPDLTDRDRAIIAFESSWTRRGGDKEVRIRSLFQIGPSRYYQLLNAVLDDPRALELDPVNVHRLRTLRDRRAAARSARSF